MNRYCLLLVLEVLFSLSILHQKRSGLAAASTTTSPVALLSPLPTRLFLVRHGQRIDFLNKDWVVDAHNPYDPYATREAIKMSAKLGRFLNDQGVNRVFTSPSLCAVQYADGAGMCMDRIHVLYPETGLCDFLNKVLFPHAEGLDDLFNEPQYLKDVCQLIDENYPSLVRPSFPESLAQFQNRCQTFIRKLCEKYPGQTLLIISHASTIDQCIKTLIPGLEVPDIELGALTELVCESDGYWKVMKLCYTDYMQQDFGFAEGIVHLCD